MKPKVNEETCIGCALCAGICPEVFEMDQAALKAKVKELDDYAPYQAKIEESKESCAVQAIK